jgi:multidrug efflux pump subunit AcrB
MFARILTFSLAHRWTVLLCVLVLIAAGCWVVYTVPVDAFPDLTNNQVVIVTEAPSMPPTEVEQLVTYPVERRLMGMPKQQEVRSLSKLGLSMVTVVFATLFLPTSHASWSTSVCNRWQLRFPRGYSRSSVRHRRPLGNSINTRLQEADSHPWN